MQALQNSYGQSSLFHCVGHGAVAHIVTKDHGGKAFALAPRFPSREAAFDAVARFAQGSDLMQLVQDSYPDPTTPPHPSLTTPAPPVDLNSFTLGLNLPPVLQKIIPRPLEWMTKVIERSTLSMDIAVVEPLSSDPERREHPMAHRPRRRRPANVCLCRLWCGIKHCGQFGSNPHHAVQLVLSDRLLIKSGHNSGCVSSRPLRRISTGNTLAGDL